MCKKVVLYYVLVSMNVYFWLFIGRVWKVFKDPKTWRELLGQVTSDPVGLQRILQALNVQEITIKRWVNNFSAPRTQSLRRLLSALPEHRERLLELIKQEFTDFSDMPLDTSSQEIPFTFYTQIFQDLGKINHTQRYWSLANIILKQALSQFDPENLGLAITIVKCMKHTKHDKIYSLRQSIGQGTPPWPSDLEHKTLFLGAESLAGLVVSTCHPSAIQNYREEAHALLGHQFEREQSAAAYPILYAGRIAGCLLVSSTEPHYFFPPARLHLIADYAHLIALTLNSEDFVHPTDLELRIMPPHSEQKGAFSTFRQRTISAENKRYKATEHLDAEQYVWEELEDELLAQQQQKYQRMYQKPHANDV
jgi:hypothetical protein